MDPVSFRPKSKPDLCDRPLRFCTLKSFVTLPGNRDLALQPSDTTLLTWRHFFKSAVNDSSVVHIHVEL
jgi:hypothetical protein